MKDADSAVVAALTNARDEGLVPRDFFSATVKNRSTGASVVVNIWSGDRTITLDVISGVTGEAETRTYIGGVNLEVGDITRVADLTIQAVDVSMSAVSDATQALIRGYDARLAKVEIHSGLLDPRTRLLVAAPEINFLGEIDAAPIETGTVGGESLIKLTVRSDAISMLTRKNPRKRSYEGQKRRSGDQFGLYGNTVGTWTVAWGQEVQDS